MFSTILVWAAFVLSSLVLLSLVYDVLRPRSDLEIQLERLQSYARGYSTYYSFWKVLTIVVIWAASGIFLFG